MGKRERVERAKSAEGGTAPEGGPAPDAPKARERDDHDRVSFPIKDGKIVWENVRESRRPELLKILRANAPRDAGQATATETLNPAVASALSSTVYDLLAQVETIIAVRVMGCSMEEAAQAFAFSVDEKNALAAPTAKVLNKYVSSALLEKYADEFTLVLLLGNLTRAKVAALRALMALHKPIDIVKVQDVKTS